MKRNIFVILIAIVLLFGLASCEITPTEPTDGYKVSFETNGGNYIKPLVVKENEKIDLPTPKKQDFSFYGWYIDKDLTEMFEEDTIINEDITLYARWVDGYIIKTFTDLDNIRNDLSAKYYLANDIDCMNAKFNTIGSLETPFTGSFDGQGYSLCNFNIQSSDTIAYLGLFGYNKGKITNLIIKDSIIVFENNFTSELVYSSVLVGQNDGTISNCEIVNVSLSNTKVGGKHYTKNGAVRQGLIAGANTGSISNCSVIGDVTLVNRELASKNSYTKTYVRCGGVTGANLGLIENCFANVNVSCTGYFADYIGQIYIDDGNVGEAGAIAAVNEENAKIINCLVMGSVFANFHDGDVVNRNSGEIMNCHRSSLMEISELYRVHALLAHEDVTSSIEFYQNVLVWDNTIWNYTDIDLSNGKYPYLVFN